MWLEEASTYPDVVGGSKHLPGCGWRKQAPTRMWLKEASTYPDVVRGVRVGGGEARGAAVALLGGVAATHVLLHGALPAPARPALQVGCWRGSGCLVKVMVIVMDLNITLRNIHLVI